MHVPIYVYKIWHVTPIWVHFGAPLKGLVEHPEVVAHYTHEGVALEHAREHPLIKGVVYSYTPFLTVQYLPHMAGQINY